MRVAVIGPGGEIASELIANLRAVEGVTAELFPVDATPQVDQEFHTIVHLTTTWDRSLTFLDSSVFSAVFLFSSFSCSLSNRMS